MSHVIDTRSRWSTLIAGGAKEPGEMAAAASGGDPVLIVGAPGRATEIARLIHALSPRRDQPLVVFDGRGLPELLVYSELFGHCAGAFIGAYRAKRGRVWRAERGMLLLEHIEAMPPRVRTGVERFAETGEICPLGVAVPEGRVDVRIIATTAAAAAVPAAGPGRVSDGSASS